MCLQMRNFFILLLAANVAQSQLQPCPDRDGFNTACSITAELGKPLGGNYSYRNGEKNIHESNPTLYKLRLTIPYGNDRRVRDNNNDYESIKFIRRDDVVEFEGSSKSAVVLASEGHPCGCNADDKKIWKIYRALDDRFQLGWLMKVDERVGTLCVGTIGHLNSPNLPYALPSYYLEFKMVHQCASWFFELLAELGQVNNNLVTTLEVNKEDGSCLFGYAPHNLITEDRFDWDYDDSSANYIFCFLALPNRFNTYPPGVWPNSALYVEYKRQFGEYKVQPMPITTDQFWTSRYMTDFDPTLLYLKWTRMGLFSLNYPNGITTRRAGIYDDYFINCERKRCRFYSDARYLKLGMKYDANPLIGINYKKLWSANIDPKFISYRVDGDKIDYQIQDDMVIGGKFRCVPIAKKLVINPDSIFKGFITFEDNEIVTSENCAHEAKKRTNGGIVGVLKGPNGECTGVGPGVKRSDFIEADPNEKGYYHCFNRLALYRAISTRDEYKFDDYNSECKIALVAPMNSGLYKIDKTWKLNFYEFPMFIKYSINSRMLDYTKRLIVCYDEIPPDSQVHYGGVCPDYVLVKEVINGQDVETVIVKGKRILCIDGADFTLAIQVSVEEILTEV